MRVRHLSLLVALGVGTTARAAAQDCGEIRVWTARALATVLPRAEAIAELETICASSIDDAVFLAAIEALAQRSP